MSHRVTLICDTCSEHYTLENGMEFPPYWLGVQIAVGNKEGTTMGNYEMYVQFCSQECFQKYSGGVEIKHHIAFVDREDFEGDEPEEEAC